MNIHPSILSALQVFKVVADCGSFSLAAKKLNITQSAVSHRIKQLEELVGVTLVERSTRFLTITSKGKHLARSADIALIEIENALAAIKPENQSGPLSITVASALATKWLIPKLWGFDKENPHHSISLISQEHVVDLRQENIDGGIRFIMKVEEGLHYTHLCDDLMLPVASPSLVKDKNIINHPELLLNYPLMNLVFNEKLDKLYSWENWFETLKTPVGNIKKAQTFNRTDIALQAAMAGQGVVLARTSLLENDLLDSGLLVQVGKAMPTKQSYYFVCLPENANKVAIVSFRDWLKDEMMKTYERLSAAIVHI